MAQPQQGRRRVRRRAGDGPPIETTTLPRRNYNEALQQWSQEQRIGHGDEGQGNMIMLTRIDPLLSSSRSYQRRIKPPPLPPHETTPTIAPTGESYASSSEAAANGGRNMSVSEGAASVWESQPWRYTMGISFVLGLFVLYLLLPKGLRAQYCKAYPRRYAKSARKRERTRWLHQHGHENESQSTVTAGVSLPPYDAASGGYSPQRDVRFAPIPLGQKQRARARRQREFRRQILYQKLQDAKEEGRLYQEEQQQQPRQHPPSDDTSSFARNRGNGGGSSTILSGRTTGDSSGFGSTFQGRDKYDTGYASLSSQSNSREPPPQPNVSQHTPPRKSNTKRTNSPPSPLHPAVPRVPPETIVNETMQRLRGRGIRLLAHGVQCQPKRVWVKLDDLEENPEHCFVTWQTETPRRLASPSGAGPEVSLVLVRGSLHKIPLRDVLYVDVGKRTTALLKAIHVKESLCFSFLTQNGSLDLQTNSVLERDALVSCFCMVLDEVHTGVDWRALYESSPDPSLVTSSSSAATSSMITNDDDKNSNNNNKHQKNYEESTTTSSSEMMTFGSDVVEI